MKIAMIGHKRIPSREGGVEVVVNEISTRLVQCGNQVIAYNRRGKNVQDKSVDKNKHRLKEYKGIKIITVPTINRKGIDALIYSFFASIAVLFEKCDIIHYHAEGPAAMLWIPKLFRKKVIVTIHGLDWKRSKWGGFASKYIKFGEKMVAKYADKVIVLSKDIQEYFKNTYNKQTYFIPNGVNKPKICQANIIKSKYNLNKDDYILFLARIVPEKGLHYLIKAFQQIKTDKKLVIVGGASHTNQYLEEIKEMASQDNRIIMTGFVQGTELDELYSNCYFYCLPSDVEGMPLSLLEAMSYGCYCLISNIEENMQIANKYGISFEKGDVKDLQKKIQMLLSNKISNYNKDEISNYICKKYSWELVIDDLLKIYEQDYNSISKVYSWQNIIKKLFKFYKEN